MPKEHLTRVVEIRTVEIRVPEIPEFVQNLIGAVMFTILQIILSVFAALSFTKSPGAELLGVAMLSGLLMINYMMVSSIEEEPKSRDSEGTTGEGDA